MAATGNEVLYVSRNGSYKAITAQDVANLGSTGLVNSVNGQTNIVVLDAEDVGALPDTAVAANVDPVSVTFAADLVAALIAAGLMEAA